MSKEIGWTSLILETNRKYVMDVMNRNGQRPHGQDQLIQLIMRQLEVPWHVQVVHALQESNTVVIWPAMPEIYLLAVIIFFNLQMVFCYC